MNINPGLIITAISLGIGVFAKAALITGVTASTDMGTFGTNLFDLDTTINGAGLPGNTPALTGIHAARDSNPINTWAGDQFTGNITFNLNDTYNLAGFSFWNYNGGNDIGIQGVTIQSSTDGTNFTTILDAPTEFNIGNNVLAWGQKLSIQGRASFSGSGVEEARRVNQRGLNFPIAE